MDVDKINCVAGYLSDECEVDLSGIVERLHEDGVTVAVPRVHAQDMQFVQVGPSQELVKNTWGILEPAVGQVVGIGEIDVVFAPLVGFSSKGARLGRGGGFYDRAFQGVDRPFLIGVGYEFQLDDDIQPNSTDVPLDAVVTENTWRVFDTSVEAVLRED